MRSLPCYAVGVLALAAPGAQGLASSDGLTVPSGRGVSIDGLATEGEWDDAARRTLRSAAGDIRIRIKHDGEALLVSFSGLSSSPFRVPEVLVAGDPTSATLGEHSWWFHASYTDCVSNGSFNEWGSCGDHPAIFQANNLSDDADGNAVFPEIFELRLPLATLRLEPGGRFALAFVTTDTAETWELWPAGAAMASPSTWATAFLGGADEP